MRLVQRLKLCEPRFALGIAVGDRVLMLEFAIYSVIPPEGCAAILWRSSSKKVEAAEALKLTAPDLLKAAIIDEIVPEPIGGAHRDRVIVDTLVAGHDSIVLEAGSHDDSIRIATDDLVRIADARIADICIEE